MRLSEEENVAPCHSEESSLWNPPIALTLAEQKMAARTRKTR